MINRVFIAPDAYKELCRHRLEKHFTKAVIKLKKGDNRGVDLKKRKPKSLNIWSFRITRKYRAFARRRGNELTVYAIDDHQ